MYWWFVHFMFWNSILGVAPCTGCPELVKLKVLSDHLVFGVCSMHRVPSAIRTFSCRLTWEYPTSVFEAVCIGFLVAVSTSFRSSALTRLTRYSKFCEEFLAPRAAWYQVDLSRFHWYHRLSFLNCWAFSCSRLLTSFLTWRSAFRSDQKENYWNG